MSIKITADSSANLLSLEGVEFSSVPILIATRERNFIDDEKLNPAEFRSYFSGYKERSSTACPSPGDWLSAFGDADQIIGIVLTGKLSGAYNSAVIAANMYMQDHPGRKVYIMDSLSTGPELQVLAEKAAELSRNGVSFEEAVEKMKSYSKTTHLAFILSSLHNFAVNGRVNHVLAKSVEVLNIKIVGRASTEGDLEPMHKCRGEKNAISCLWDDMKKDGYKGGKVRLHHSGNLEAATKMADMIKREFPNADIEINENRGLCSYYAETGSLLAGYES